MKKSELKEQLIHQQKIILAYENEIKQLAEKQLKTVVEKIINKKHERIFIILTIDNN